MNNNINNNVNGISPYFPNQPTVISKDSNMNINYNEGSEGYNRFSNEVPASSNYNNNNNSIQTNQP